MHWTLPHCWLWCRSDMNTDWQETHQIWDKPPNHIICPLCLFPGSWSKIASGHVVCSAKCKKNIVWSLQTCCPFLKSLGMIYLDVFCFLTSLKVRGSGWACRAPCHPHLQSQNICVGQQACSFCLGHFETILSLSLLSFLFVVSNANNSIMKTFFFFLNRFYKTNCWNCRECFVWDTVAYYVKSQLEGHLELKLLSRKCGFFS